MVSILLLEVKYAIKRQLYSKTFAVREAAPHLLALMARTQCSVTLPVLSTQLHQM